MAAPSYNAGTLALNQPSTHENTNPPMSYSNQRGTWSPFFGEPLREFQVNPYDDFRRENFALPDAYKGSNPFLTTIVIRLVTEDDLWPGRIGLPFRVTEGENSISWDELHFNNHLLGPVPEEGVSRLITQQQTERKDHYVRYGLALMLEHGE